MKKLFIDIKGDYKTGKTTITYLIKEFLKKEGFNVDLNFSEEHHSEKDFDEDATLHLYNKTKVLNEQVKIILSEKNIMKLPKVDQSKVKLLNEGIDPKNNIIMKTWFYYLYNYINELKEKRKKRAERKKILSELYLEYIMWQNYLDHEGKMYGMCGYDEDDMQEIKRLERKRDEAQKKYYELKYNKS